MVVSGCAGAKASTVTPTDGVASLPMADFPELSQSGGQAVISVAGVKGMVVVFQRPDGSYGAVSQKCTHAGCKVAYEGGEDQLQCRCHGSAFSPDGAVVNGPAKEPLKTYPVQVEGDTLMVSTGG